MPILFGQNCVDITIYKKKDAEFLLKFLRENNVPFFDCFNNKKMEDKVRAKILINKYNTEKHPFDIDFYFFHKLNKKQKDIIFTTLIPYCNITYSFLSILFHLITLEEKTKIMFFIE